MRDGLVRRRCVRRRGRVRDHLVCHRGIAHTADTTQYRQARLASLTPPSVGRPVVPSLLVFVDFFHICSVTATTTTQREGEGRSSRLNQGPDSASAEWSKGFDGSAARAKVSPRALLFVPR